MSFNKIYPDSFNQSTGRIINMDDDKYNGRVNIAEPPSPNIQFKMAEKISLKNKASSYCDALVGTVEDSLLSQVYFSAGNVQILQNGLRAGVYKMSDNKIVMPPQNEDALKIIMRSTFLQYAEFLPNQITQQVERLNKIVLDYAVPSLYNEAMGYLKYTQDASTLVVPMDRPLNHDRAYKQLELKNYF
jgi:hypothetical protein